jgi:hypothetical protein
VTYDTSPPTRSTVHPQDIPDATSARYSNVPPPNVPPPNVPPPNVPPPNVPPPYNPHQSAPTSMHAPPAHPDPYRRNTFNSTVERNPRGPVPTSDYNNYNASQNQPRPTDARLTPNAAATQSNSTLSHYNNYNASQNQPMPTDTRPIPNAAATQSNSTWSHYINYNASQNQPRPTDTRPIPNAAATQSNSTWFPSQPSPPYSSVPPQVSAHTPWRSPQSTSSYYSNGPHGDHRYDPPGIAYKASARTTYSSNQFSSNLQPVLANYHHPPYFSNTCASQYYDVHPSTSHSILARYHSASLQAASNRRC